MLYCLTEAGATHHWITPQLYNEVYSVDIECISIMYCCNMPVLSSNLLSVIANIMPNSVFALTEASFSFGMVQNCMTVQVCVYVLS